MKLATIMERRELKLLQYGVVVESWKQIGYGRGKRLFEKTFTTEEQKQCRELYKTYSRWYSGWQGTGMPNTHAMPVRKYHLAMRLSNFFGAL
jgi:hypothetical protein